MRHYRVYKDFTNFIEIDERELVKALTAFQKSAGVIFQNGAMSKIEAIIPDDIKMMGWNTGYKPSPEEMGEINRDITCRSARGLIGQIKEHLALRPSQPFKELISSVTKNTKGFTSIGSLILK